MSDRSLLGLAGNGRSAQGSQVSESRLRAEDAMHFNNASSSNEPYHDQESSGRAGSHYELNMECDNVEEIGCNIKSAMKLFLPVSLCMVVVVGIMKETDNYHYSSQSVIRYARMMLTDQTVDISARDWQLIANAFTVLMLIVVVNFLLLIYKFRCYKTFRVWLIMSSLMLLTVSVIILIYVILSSTPSHPQSQPIAATLLPPKSKLESTTITVTSKPPNKPFIEFLETKAKIGQFNRRFLLPRIKSLVSIDYFRYVKVNLNRPCKLWCNANKCNLRDCKVKVLSDPSKCPMPTYDDELSTVNTELASDQLNLLIKLFECNDNDDHDLQYVDLLINPERFTGYSGESANRVWRAIYDENCFIRKSHSPFNSELCYEERLFYEAISGLHSSISIHLCAEYPSMGLIGTFEPNLDEFLRRFEGHNDYLENLYTLFLLELKALVASEPILLKRVNWPEPSTRDAVQDLLKVMNRIDIPTFEDLTLKPSHVSHELAIHFRNITTTIVDCVACDKCKLWGKVQLRGLGAAFKILSVKDVKKLNLNHQEIVSLINAVARLSHSIRQLENFRDLLLSKHNRIGNNNN